MADRVRDRLHNGLVYLLMLCEFTKIGLRLQPVLEHTPDDSAIRCIVCPLSRGEFGAESCIARIGDEYQISAKTSGFLLPAGFNGLIQGIMMIKDCKEFRYF